ncbi:valine--tRNA ligase [Candidatus Formimonas warabiya]|uniref:valine--tRNA ligase n=1 Tax=Formimonas warabiya TaxID=1761012 RepID=UPI0011D0D30F|nr:valine--tRNA ligase [Candidatus Formimonas warabiya]
MEQAKNISTTYDPKKVEEKWYRYWEENHFFHDEVNREQEAFSIVMPPPNVTGQLHMGHALDNTIQDILTRWRRMQGYNTLWLPGTDHAGIATQARVEENLAQSNISKYDLGREKFLEKVWEWKKHYHARISKQLRLLGSSCDWDRERFTMDEGCSQAVQEVFVKLYEKGLIYRGSYIINWCPKCQTTISDIEVEHTEKEGKLYYLRYPIKDSEAFIPIATTRPETMLGDTAVAVNPEDERYRDLIGLTVLLPIVNREIPIIADAYVDPSFGTGAVKITPAHDPNDFEIGLRHHLPQISVIDKEAKMTAEAGKYQGMDRYECRAKLIEEFKSLGLFDRIEEHAHAVGECYRCGTVIEPLVSPQWFVKMKPLAEPAIQAVLDGQIRFVPERFTKIYIGWLENIRDWCISRQLWWGHRIPVWYCPDCGEVICRKEPPQSCTKCGSNHLEQDPDVLDTWFSSALWPFSTLGWPEQTEDLSYYYPTSVLVTGRDIIFFWVARMIFMGLEFMKQEPFKEVFIHGLVLDALGRKMSKSLGNGVDPLEIIDRYGADTLRFMLVTGNTPGNDLRFQEERLEAARNFANKIWNASRFVMMNLTDYSPGAEPIQFNMADKWILERYRATLTDVTRFLEKYELGEAARTLYEFIWSEFCDWYIELAKLRLYKETGAEKHTAQFVLTHVLKGIMQLLHPFMPFITEEIWQHLPENKGTIMLSSWPDPGELASYAQEEEDMNLVMDVVRSVRNIRAEMNVPLGKRVNMVILTDETSKAVLEKGKGYLAGLCQADTVEFFPPHTEKPEQAAAAVVKGIEIFVPLKDLIDLDKEISRLEKEVGNMDKELARLHGKLNNADFLAKAPAQVVEKEKAKEEEYRLKKNALLERLIMLKG